MADFNIIGFGYDWNQARNPKQYVEPRTCSFCAGVILQPDPDDNSKLMCFSCGYSQKNPDFKDEWNPDGDSESETFEQIKEKYKKQQSRIIQGNKRKSK